MKRQQSYVSPTDKKLALAAAFYPKSYKELSPKYSKSFNNISNDQCPLKKLDKPLFKEIEESHGWKLTFCGIAGPIEDSEDEDFEVSMKKSYSYQPDKILSPPVFVSEAKLRINRKRKSNFRNSGGYFFDKYMKRLREKYMFNRGISQEQEPDYNDDIEEEISAINGFQMSNREDVDAIDIDHRLVNRPQNLPLKDDLYPTRFGSSKCWDVPSSTSSTKFWGDAISGGMVNDASPNVINDITSVSCKYSDSNSETLKAMETLYLCKFNVSAVGDWLCLKEFEEDWSPMQQTCISVIQANESGKETNLDGNNKCEVNSNGDENQLETHNQLNIEKRNLMGMARFSIKGLIESSLSAGHTLDSDNEPLQQFFVIMEYIMRHGLKPPKTFFLPNKHFWGVLEHLEKLDSEVAGITDSIKNLPNVRTSLGKGRAWLRMSLMQKKLAQHLKIIVDNKKVFSEWYEKDAFMTSEEGTELIGHLVGLNCIDANLCMKGDDLDNQVTVIDYSLYMQQNKLLKTTSTNNEELDETDENETNENIMQQLADQKNYLEERNRHLETKNSELVEKSQLLKSCNMALENELKAAKIQLHQLQSDRIQIIEEKENQAATHFKTLQEREKDLEMERETLRNSKTSLDELLQSIQKDLRQETNHRMEVENELKQEISSKQELEMTVKLLEKEVFDKQDGILTLREQLDNVKAINHDLYNRLQEKTNSEQEKTRLVVKLEGESRKLATKVVKMQQQIGESEKQMEIARSRIDELSDQLQQSEKQKSVQTNNLQIEREWREALQSQVKVAEEDKNKLRVKADELTIVTQQLKCVKEEREKLQQMNLQHEMTIEDLAGHLGKSKQEVGEIKEIQRENLSQKWEKDKHVTACTLCAKPFNISRRKHHCRKCGQIFCNLCSDNQMTLASSAKPVRVCDNCHQQLMQRFSSN